MQRRHFLIETGRSAPGLAVLTGAALALAALVVTVARLNLTPAGTAPPISAVVPGEPSPAAVSHRARLPDKWAEADVNTRRLHPDAFGDVPPSVRRELGRLGCTIPQTFGSDRPHNIISGRFMSPTRTDWAALCSRDRISTILVFPAGEAAPAIEVAAAPDVRYLQGLGGDAIGFSRALAVADPQFIRDHHQPDDPPLPSLDHDGISDVFVEKGSSVLYWHSGGWLQLTGTD